MFASYHYPLGMPDTSHLRPATAAEIADALSFALRYQGRKRVNHADDMMARITADRLVQHLTESGFVLMKGTAAAAPSTSAMPSAERDQGVTGLAPWPSRAQGFRVQYGIDAEFLADMGEGAGAAGAEMRGVIAVARA